MFLPCEVAVKSVIPAIKASLVRELAKKDFKQGDIAQLLGISQSAVSKYIRKIRGNVIKLDNLAEIDPLINDMVKILLKEKFQREKILKRVCEACYIIRKNELMCKLCHKTELTVADECNFCIN